ncbi:ExbD/TolR family protein [Armatimonas rosea]|uniref:Biopolymer transport protein ExbD n=1 Tax=Armatimonas rosea TaxID=685828 RepID=A0A7W9STT5_ARMRO|nr:biopolymer transporter ExbD [Armatimonas rosea]MBB6052706.1 biopolymer transport protein ExbD [Armatimonas rosea]
MAHIKRREFKKTKIEIIPMIDTMFFLLVFFILASLNVIDMKGAQVKLPSSTNQDRQVQAKITLTIRENGDMVVNKTEVVHKVEELPDYLVQQLQGQVDANNLPLTPENAVVVINADRKAHYSVVRNCIDAARRVKFRKFSIATDPKFGNG